MKQCMRENAGIGYETPWTGLRAGDSVDGSLSDAASAAASLLGYVRFNHRTTRECDFGIKYCHNSSKIAIVVIATCASFC